MGDLITLCNDCHAIFHQNRNLTESEDIESPAFIRNMITDFSRDLGDQDHIFSNISQATRLYRDSGANEETFMQAMYDARALAKKATQIRHLNSFGNPNRMPYFFRCLNGALRPQDNAYYTA